MGLSSKQVSSDGFDWGKSLETQKSPSPMMMPIRRHHHHHHHQHQQFLQNQPEQLKCPRCDSGNTKFCYYNNYNKSQPRHFCRTCKRHWTKGGTLRNVPVGGGRKNKRITKSSSAASSDSMRRRGINSQITVQTQSQRQNFPVVSLGHQKNLLELFHHGLLRPPASPPFHSLFSSGGFEGINYSADHQHGFFLGSNSLPSFTLPDSSSFETKPFQISTSFPSFDIYNYFSQDQFKTIDQDPTSSINRSMNSLPTNASSILNDMTNVWNWEDVDTFVSTGLNLRWDDSDFSNPQKL